MRWPYEWARTFAIVVKVSNQVQVPSIQNEAPYERRYRRRTTCWRINRRSREGRNEVPPVNQSPTRSMGLLQEVWVRTESTNLHTFRTNLALEKSGSCEKSQEGNANFGRRSTRTKYQVSRTKRRINEDIIGALLAGGSIGAAERAEPKCRLWPYVCAVIK